MSDRRRLFCRESQPREVLQRRAQERRERYLAENGKTEQYQKEFGGQKRVIGTSSN
jgi:hypothetical protein